ADAARARLYVYPAAVGEAAPHCQSLHLPPRSGRLQAETIRDRATAHRLLLLGDRADSPGGINRNRVRHGIRSRSFNRVMSRSTTSTRRPASTPAAAERVS